MALIYFIERNIRGAWIVYGIIGIKQYYGYTRKQAIQLYKEQIRMERIVNVDV